MNSIILNDDDTTFAFSIVSILNEKFPQCFARFDQVRNNTKVTFSGPIAYVIDALGEIKYLATSIQTKLMRNEVPIAVKEYTQFTVPMPQHFSNMIRRVIIGDVPTMAIEFVHVIKHNSSMNDDVLVHRLGLIPVLADPALFSTTQECVCDAGCPWCHLEFELEFSNDTEEKKKQKYVLSDALVYKPSRPDAPVSLIPNIPLIAVDDTKPTELKLKCIATKNKPRVHAKWASTCMCVCVPVIEITLTEDLSTVSLCPRNVFDVTDNGRVVVSRTESCSLCGECKQEVKTSTKTYWVRIESNEQLSPERILMDALKIIAIKCEQYTNNALSTSV